MLGAGRIIAVANQKGGVGKTTTVINLATALAAVGRKVLVVDLDPQGNASTGLGIANAQRSTGTYDLLLGKISLDEALIETAVPNLAIVASTIDLSAAELELVDTERREYLLRDAIRSAVEKFNYVLIDCPPALGLLTLNGLIAAHTVLVPLQCEFLALEGLSQLVRTIERVTTRFNPKLQLEGIVLTMYDTRNKLSSLVSDDVRGYFGEKVYKTVIPRNVRVSEAPSHGKPVLLYDLSCAGSQAYVHLAGEVLRRDTKKNTGPNTTEDSALVPNNLRKTNPSEAGSQRAAQAPLLTKTDAVGHTGDPALSSTEGPTADTTGDNL
ncbi:MAG: chromosome partitioning protein ParA [Rhodospirillaceae bacterium]|nr:chromosome partitioning protein ParA [Rhodospirillaceae bacterium]